MIPPLRCIFCDDTGWVTDVTGIRRLCSTCDGAGMTAEDRIVIMLAALRLCLEAMNQDGCVSEETARLAARKAINWTRTP